jgi:hypothetical protein
VVAEPEVAQEYFDRLGLAPQELLLVNVAELIERLGARAEATHELKRLADALDLRETARLQYMGGPPSLDWIHAHTLYAIAGAHASAVRVGIEMVESYLAFGDADGARELLERALIPTAITWGLADFIIDLRAQHTVVLAFCGEVEKARALGDELLALTAGVNDGRREEVVSRRRAVERIAVWEV